MKSIKQIPLSESHYNEEATNGWFLEDEEELEWEDLCKGPFCESTGIDKL